jgi:signal transduction histidine kinase
MGVDLDEVSEVEKLADKACQDTRESLELLHNNRQDGSLVSCLRDYLERYRKNSGVDFRLDVPASEVRLEAQVEFELSRIYREALTNISKHSGAHNVHVKVEAVNNHFEVCVADDGCGFDALAHYHDGVQARGHGLAVMRERAESIGGKFRVLSMPGLGTEIQVEVPLNRNGIKLLWVKR